LDIKEIRELIALMRRNELTEFEMETEGFRIKLKKGGDPVVTHAPAYYAPQAAPAPAPAAAAPAAPATNGGETAPTGRLIKSPTVGTFYSAASPEASPYIEVGMEVNEETVVGIIEAMKVMNEIKAETSGTIIEILVENGKPVQYGQPLFRLQ
jgi:acetyl-CoA carboxylase biotin carboxyl carrier protein